MFEMIQSFLPSEWHRTVEFLGAPIWWIPNWQAGIVNFGWFGDTGWETTLKRVFLLMPSLLLIVAVWTTMVSLYTIPFRTGRGKFLTTIALGWWDTGRGVWFYWAGIARFAFVLVGWAWSTLALAVRLVTRTLRGAVSSPFALMDWGSRKYFRPGVPWLAVLLTLIWSGLEATIFSFTLMPTLTEVLADITGFEPNRLIMMPVLWLFLFLLIAGSFASIHVMNEAIRSRHVGQAIQMVVVEFFVAFFEVIFLYRELIDAITPWIAQQSGGQFQMGLFSTLALGLFGWIGIRGMTWMLFGRFGTPALIQVLSRQVPQADAVAVATPAPLPPDLWRDPINALKAESQWFKSESLRAFELASLPVLQLLAVAINFPIVALRSRPAFTFPIRNIEALMADTPLVDAPKSARNRPPTRSQVENDRGQEERI